MANDSSRKALSSFKCCILLPVADDAAVGRPA